MAKKRTVTNEFEAYLEKKGVTDEAMSNHLGINRKTFTSMRKNPLTIKIGFAYKIAMYFKEYVPHFIDLILIGKCLDEEQDIDTNGTDWDLNVIAEMKQNTMQIDTSVDERPKKETNVKPLAPTKIDPVTGVVVLVEDKHDEYEG